MHRATAAPPTTSRLQSTTNPTNHLLTPLRAERRYRAAQRMDQLPPGGGGTTDLFIAWAKGWPDAGTGQGGGPPGMGWWSWRGRREPRRVRSPGGAAEPVGEPRALLPAPVVVQDMMTVAEDFSYFRPRRRLGRGHLQRHAAAVPLSERDVDVRFGPEQVMPQAGRDADDLHGVARPIRPRPQAIGAGPSPLHPG